MSQQAYITNESERLEKLAEYLAHGIANNAAGAAVGYSPGRVSQLLQQDDFLQMVTEKRAEMTEQYVNVNTALDALEARSLANLLTQVSVNQDPDLNLRVASFANKAMRRGQANPLGKPIDPQGADNLIKLEFNVAFVQNIQQGKVLDGRDPTKEIESVHAMATPEMVNRLLDTAAGGAKAKAFTMVDSFAIDVPGQGS